MKMISTHSLCGHVDYQSHNFFRRPYDDYVHQFENVIIKGKQNNDLYVSSCGTIMFDEAVRPRLISNCLSISGVCHICTPIMRIGYFLERINTDGNEILSNELSVEEVKSYTKCDVEELQYSFPLYQDNSVRIIRCFVKDHTPIETFEFKDVGVTYDRPPSQLTQKFFEYPSEVDHVVRRICILASEKNMDKSEYLFIDASKKDEFSEGPIIKSDKYMFIEKYLPIYVDFDLVGKNKNYIRARQLKNVELRLESEEKDNTYGDVLVFYESMLIL